MIVCNLRKVFLFLQDYILTVYFYADITPFFTFLFIFLVMQS